MQGTMTYMYQQKQQRKSCLVTTRQPNEHINPTYTGTSIRQTDYKPIAEWLTSKHQVLASGWVVSYNLQWNESGR